MPNAPVEFYFDFNSPYGYIAAHLIDDLAAKYGREADWKPFLLGAVFKVTGARPLPHLPMKGDYARHDFARSARYHGIEYNPPKDFPFSPVAASRAVYWAKDRDPPRGREMALALYAAALRDAGDISSPEAVAGVAAGIGFERGAVLDGLQDPAVKERLKAETDAAIERNIFGSPFVIVDGEAFWGSDRLDMVERWLDAGGW